VVIADQMLPLQGVVIIRISLFQGVALRERIVALQATSLVLLGVAISTHGMRNMLNVNNPGWEYYQYASTGLRPWLIALALSGLD
jgi:hypothetical protein